MTETVDPRIAAAFAEVFPDAAPATPQTGPADVKGWDSMNHIRFILAVEERLGIVFRPREVARVRSIADLQALAARRTAMPPSAW